jgi:hypothetical protein
LNLFLKLLRIFDKTAIPVFWNFGSGSRGPINYGSSGSESGTLLTVLYFVVMRSDHCRDIDKALAAEREAADLKEKETEVQKEQEEL